ncbi:discoidin domain-containing protein, partial [Thomasclavelia cocleata]|uniref:discoidin domain-containing protein n=2 Tax=Thomasclavelia cocleata TaxID=69824 RepID=UPI00255AF8F3
MNKFLRSTLAVVLTLSCFPLTNNKIEALSSNVNVTATDNQVVIGNEYIERQFSIADNKLETTNIINKRTESGNTVFTPANGSEEFIIKTVKEERAPISLEAIDRTNWSAVSDSYQNVSGPSDGPAANLIDGNLDSIWHSNYGGGTGSRNFPYNVLFNLHNQTTFQSFSYTPRQNGEATNGNLKGYELWVYNGTITEDLAFDSNQWQKVAEGNFIYDGVNPIYVNLAQETTATQIKLVAISANNGASFAGGAEFNLHKDKAPEIVDDRSFKASDLTLKDDGVKVEDTTATINEVEKVGKKVTFSFEPYEFKNVEYTINEVIVIYEDDHFMRKYMEISVPENQAENAVIDYIDLESFNINKSDTTWTIPTGKGGVVSMDEFKANLGQPIYIQGMFMGCEFPVADTQIIDNNGYMRYYSGKSFNRLVEDNQAAYADGKVNYMTWQTVAGAARSTENAVIQSDFFEYIKSIATPSEFRIQYNSWFDNMMLIDDENILNSFIEIDRELNATGTRPLDSYVVDDGWNNYNDTRVVDAARSGTTLNSTGFWEFNSKFPNGLTTSSELVNNFGSNFGVWIGPRGGYNFYGSLADILTKNGTGSKAGGSIDVADRVYVENFKEMAIDWQKEYKVNYWKWDGFADTYQYNAFPASDGVPGYANNHMTGGYKNMYHVTDLWEAWIDLMEAVRQSEKDDNINNLWISLTCYVNPSPWYLQWANSVWIQCTHDRGDTGPINNKMDTMLTYREAVYYDFIKSHEFQFPLANLYNHDPVYGVEGTGININSMTDEQFKNYLYMMSTRGTGFWELYYSDSIMTKGKYEVNAEFLAWAEENFHILKNAKMIGGNPANGVKLGGIGSSTTYDTYGFSAWDGEDGIISMRNPDTTAKTITFILDRNIGLSESIQGKTLYNTLTHSYSMPENGNNAYQTFNYGDEVTVTLQPGETRIWSLSTTQDMTAPNYVKLVTDGDKTLIVKFNEKVVGNSFSVEVDGEEVEVEQVNKSVDQITYEIVLANKPLNGKEIVVKANDIVDLNGNTIKDADKMVVYHKNNVALTVKTDMLTGEKTVGTTTKSLSDNNGFSVLVDINSTNSNKILAKQTNGYEVGINEDGKAYFTLNGVTATSKVVVNNGENHIIQAVKENNGILKLYVDGNLQSSAYSLENKTYVIDADKTIIGSDGFEGVIGLKVLDTALGYDEFVADEGSEFISQDKITVTATSYDIGESATPDRANDGNTNTYWASSATEDNTVTSQYLTYDLNNTYNISKFQYIPRYDSAQALNCTGNILEYVIEISMDGENWQQVASGSTIRTDRGITDIVLNSSVEAKYVRLGGTSTYHWQPSNANKILAAAEFKVYGQEIIDASTLEARVEELEAIDTTDFTISSVEDFEELLAEAKDLLNNLSSQEEVDDMLESLMNAENILIKRGNIDSLVALVNEYDNLEESDYTAESWEIYISALNLAKAIVADNSNSSQEDVDQVKQILVDAKNALVAVDVSDINKTALTIAVEMAGNVTAEDLDKVVPAVVTEFNAALEEARTILANDNATQEEVDASFARLSVAMHMLEFLKGDKTELQDLVDSTADLVEGNYTEESW